MGMPKEIAGPLHQALFDEIAWATEDEVREPLAQRRAVVKSRVDPSCSLIRCCLPADGGDDGCIRMRDGLLNYTSFFFSF